MAERTKYLVERLNQADRKKLVMVYRRAREEGVADPPTAIAAAARTLCKTEAQWNGARGEEAFAVVVGLLAFIGELKLVDPAWPVDKATQDMVHSATLEERREEQHTIVLTD